MSLRALLERYADGRQICNCGRAYYSMTGTAHIVGGPRDGETINDHPICQYGCQVAQMSAVDDVAKRAASELGLTVDWSIPHNPANFNPEKP